MTNTALSLLRNEIVDEVREYNKEIDLILQHNDPNVLHYKHNLQDSIRKPDSIFMATSTACALHELPPKTEWTDAEWIKFAKKHATSKPKAGVLNWGGNLSSVEYKRPDDRKVELKEVTVLEPNSFVVVLKSEHILEGKKRKNQTKDENAISAYVYPDCLPEC